jgi:prepilin-type processing-associated H-X9-DG protein
VNLLVCPDCAQDADQPTALSYVVNAGSATYDFTPALDTGVFRNLVPIAGSTASAPISLSSVRTTSRRPMLSEARFTIDTATDYASTGYVPSYSGQDNRVWSETWKNAATFTVANLRGPNLTSLQLGFPWPELFGATGSTVTFGQILPPIHAGIVIVTFCDGHVESLDVNGQCSAYDSSQIR